uniref:hypothetical protein n=1 Tax=Ligilactobacillus murinus TaxID=1622 RepID=UPI001958EE95
LASLLIYSEKATSPQVGTITKDDRNHGYTHQGRSYKYTHASATTGAITGSLPDDRRKSE